MRSLLILPAALSVLVLAGPAFADEGGMITAADTCAKYDFHLDRLLPEAKGQAATEAKVLRSEGDKLCAQGKYDAGAAKLRQALNTIGWTMPG